MIICICRGKSERDVTKAIGNGAASVRDLQRCGIGDQCGSCVKSLRSMIALTSTAAMPAAAMAAGPCPTCGSAAVSASAMA